MSFLLQYWDVIAFYVIVVILLYVFRKKFEFQGIIALYRTKIGLNFMKNTGKKHPVFWHRVGMASIILGFIGMVFITIYLFYGLYALFFIPNAPPTLSPVIPGVKIPGVPFTFPLWYTLIGLLLAVLVHEGMHGIFASAYKIRIKSSGFAFFGPLPAAFVDLDEKSMVKKPKRQQLAILSGGPFANVAFAIVAFILVLGISSLAGILTNEEGASYTSLQNGSAAYAAGLPSNGTLTSLDAPITNTVQLTQALAKHKPGDIVNVTVDNKSYTMTLTDSPDKPGKAYMGILDVNSKFELINPSNAWLYEILIIIGSMFLWAYIISIGIGIANLLPIGPVDGGRMFLVTLMMVYPEKKAKQIWTRWSFLLLFIVIILVFVPIIKAII